MQIQGRTDLRWKIISLVKIARMKEIFISMKCGRRLKFERWRLKEDFDQRLEIIPLDELARRNSKWRLVELGRGHIL